MPSSDYNDMSKTFVFQHKVLQAFFVATKIIEKVTRDQDSRGILLNQMPVMHGQSPMAIIKFLTDATRSQFYQHMI